MKPIYKIAIFTLLSPLFSSCQENREVSKPQLKVVDEKAELEEFNRKNLESTREIKDIFTDKACKDIIKWCDKVQTSYDSLSPEGKSEASEFLVAIRKSHRVAELARALHVFSYKEQSGVDSAREFKNVVDEHFAMMKELLILHEEVTGN